MNAIKRGASKRKQIERPITPSEALQILQSAIHYCQRAGLVVNFDTTPDGLKLILPDAAHEMTPEGARFALRPVVGAES